MQDAQLLRLGHPGDGGLADLCAIRPVAVMQRHGARLVFQKQALAPRERLEPGEGPLQRAGGRSVFSHHRATIRQKTFQTVRPRQRQRKPLQMPRKAFERAARQHGDGTIRCADHAPEQVPSRVGKAHILRPLDNGHQRSVEIHKQRVVLPVGKRRQAPSGFAGEIRGVGHDRNLGRFAPVSGRKGKPSQQAEPGAAASRAPFPAGRQSCEPAGWAMSSSVAPAVRASRRTAMSPTESTPTSRLSSSTTGTRRTCWSPMFRATASISSFSKQ